MSKYIISYGDMLGNAFKINDTNFYRIFGDKYNSSNHLNIKISANIIYNDNSINYNYLIAYRACMGSFYENSIVSNIYSCFERNKDIKQFIITDIVFEINDNEIGDKERLINILFPRLEQYKFNGETILKKEIVEMKKEQAETKKELVEMKKEMIEMKKNLAEMKDLLIEILAKVSFKQDMEKFDNTDKTIIYPL